MKQGNYGHLYDRSDLAHFKSRISMNNGKNVVMHVQLLYIR